MQIRYDINLYQEEIDRIYIMYLINIFESIQLNGNFKQNFL